MFIADAFVEEKFDKRSPLNKAHGFRVSVVNKYVYVYTGIRVTYTYCLIPHSFVV